MQTNFTETQLADPDLAEANKILRTCVHCGFCTATCPTYTLLGDELDSPRGRIYLMKQMLEQGKPATPSVVKHIDRCLSCLSCMTTCPSGVHYMHLVDHARVHIEETYKRPWHERLLRQVLAMVLPYPNRFRMALLGASLGRPFARFIPGRWGAMLALAPKGGAHPPARHDLPQTHESNSAMKGRVVLMTGCAQQVLAPDINAATIRILNRHGMDVVIPEGQGCCGALVHHMGREKESHEAAKRNIDAWLKAHEAGELDAIVINASGCGTTVKDYGYMLREDKAYAEKAAKVSALTKDITEVLTAIGLMPSVNDTDLTIAYHSACSMQHGQQIKLEPKKLLTQAGFTVKDVPEGHLCCGSAGTYNIMQPEIASKLKARKVANIEKTKPDVIATGNIGCMTQIGTGTGIPIVHTVQLLDWATGGTKPQALL